MRPTNRETYSMLSPSLNHFTFLDCAIFTVYLAVTVLVGLYFAKGQKNIKSYFLADKSMGYILVGVSVLAAFFPVSVIWRILEGVRKLICEKMKYWAFLQICPARSFFFEWFQT